MYCPFVLNAPFLGRKIWKHHSQDESGSYEVMVPYEWQHVCYSYNSSGYSHMVLASTHLNLYILSASYFLSYLRRSSDTAQVSLSHCVTVVNYWELA